MQIPLHPCEAEDGTEHCKKVESLQYLPRRTFASRHEGFVRILQLTFARRASLNFGISLKPRPPTFFEFVSFDQAIQHIFCFSADESHQNLVRADWMRLQKEPGSLKQDIV